jgi:hypothetical protein
MSSVITLESEPNKKGRKSWKKFHWFDYAKFDSETGQARMDVSANLVKFLTALKRENGGMLVTQSPECP